MAIQVKRTNTKEYNGILMLLYGISNSGKTYACGTLKEGETLFLDSEKSTETLRSKNHHVIHFDHGSYEKKNGYKSLKEDIKESYKEAMKYKNVVIDTLTEFESIAVAAMTAEMGFDFPRLKEYGQGAIFARKIIRSFRSLTYSGINVIFTANEKALEMAKGPNFVKTLIVPEFTQTLAQTCGKLFDIVGRLQYNHVSKIRGIRFDGSDSSFIARSRFNLGEWIKPDLPKLIEKCRNGISEEKENGNARTRKKSTKTK